MFSTTHKTYDFFKRLFDVAFSFILLVLLAPMFLFIAFAIKLESSGPLIYRQRRIGRNGIPFSYLKFRTMFVNPNYETFYKAMKEAFIQRSKGAKLPFVEQDVRLTMVGKFLRRYSLDELPQIISVLAGDLSIVGPRPPLPYEWDKYTPEQRKRLSVKPGMTGLWQVTANTTSTYADMIKLDLEYIEKRSMLLDLKILYMTIPAVLFGPLSEPKD